MRSLHLPKQRIAALAATGALLLGLLTPTGSAVADIGDEITSGLVAWYKLNETGGTAAANSAPGSAIGSGTVQGASGWTGNGQGFDFTGGANGSGNAIKLPDNLNTGLTSVTVDYDVQIDPDQANYYMFYVIGNRNPTTTAGERYMFAAGDSFHNVITKTNNAGEFNVQPTTNATLKRGLWKHITYTQTGTTGILYEDGVERARNTGVNANPADLGATTFNYLGRSAYLADHSFNGKLRDFRIYNRALTPAEAGTLSQDVLQEAVGTDSAAIELGDLTQVRSNLVLPTSGSNGTSISWSTSNAALISTTGAVTRPAEGQPNGAVDLTAQISRGGATIARTFQVTVQAIDSQADADRIAATLSLPNLGDVRGNLALPATSGTGTISWASSDPATITATGLVTRPAAGQAPRSVSLTATVTVNGRTATRTLVATVPALPADLANPTKAYLFSYFTGEAAGAEQIRYAVSKGNNALDWRVINNDNAVLTSEFGEKGLRDPFILRSHEGDKFYILATDLNTYQYGWSTTQRTGSRYIEIWESTDLVNWGNQRHVKVSTDFAGNTWAPEAYYDEALGQYVVFWASNLYPSADLTVPRNENNTYNRMMYATTRDFHTFSEPTVWIDEKQGGAGNGTIDSTIMEEDGWLYRFTVPEGDNIPRVDRSRDIYATLTPARNDWIGTGNGTGWLQRQAKVGYGQTYLGATSGTPKTFLQGEATTLFRPNQGDTNGSDGVYAFIDQAQYYNNGEGYVPFKATSLAAGDWTIVQQRNLPASPRHGTVLPITIAEYERLLTKYQPDQLMATTDVDVQTTPGAAPALPDNVTVTQGPGTPTQASLGPISVTWESVAASSYAAPGSFVVTGQVRNGGLVTATVTVAAVDTSAPDVTIVQDPVTPASGWHRSTVTVTVSATDNTDAEPHLQVDTGTGWIDYTGALSLTEDGTHMIQARATDRAGNVSAGKTITVKIDGTSPVSSAVREDGRIVTLRAADATSGIDRIEYRLDSDWIAYHGPIPVPGTAAATLSYRSVDRAGNVEAIRTLVVPSDTVELKNSVVVAAPATEYVHGRTSALSVRVSGSGGAPTGQVHVRDGATSVGTGVLLNGRATITISGSLPAGVRTLTAVYAGDSQFADSTDTVQITVAKATSTTTAKLVASTVKYGNSAVVTVKVSAPGVVPAGKITVKSGATTIATGLLTAGALRFTLRNTLTVKTHPLTISYAGTTDIAASTTAITLVVVKATSTTTVKAPPAAVSKTAAKKLTVVVTANPAIPITGTLALVVTRNGTTKATATATLRSGAGAITLPALKTAGLYRITIKYTGNNTVAGSTVAFTTTAS